MSPKNIFSHNASCFGSFSDELSSIQANLDLEQDPVNVNKIEMTPIEKSEWTKSIFIKKAKTLQNFDSKVEDDTKLPSESFPTIKCNTYIPEDIDFHAELDLSKRYDVVNKTILRCIKRFFLKIFRKNNVELTKRRYSQLKSSLIFQAMKAMWKQVFGDIENLDKVSQFIMIISSIKPANTYPFDKDIEEKANDVVSWLYRYSNKKLAKILKHEEFKQIALHVIDNHYGEIINETNNTIAKNVILYKDALKNITDQLRKGI